MTKEAQNEEVANNQFAEWDSPADSFFETVSPTQAVVEEVKKDKVVAEVKNEEEEEEIQTVDPNKDYVFEFGENGVEEEEEEDLPVGSTKEVSTGKIDSKSTLEFLKEKGLVNYTLEEGEELTADLADEILEDTWEDSVESAVAETIKELPDAVKDLINFVRKGGDYTELLGSMVKQSVSGINKDTDMDIEANQVLVLTQERQAQGYDQETITGEIEYLKDSGKLKGVVDKLFPKVIERQEKEIKKRVEAVEAQKAENKEKQRVYKSEIAEQLKATEDIKGVVINKKDKEQLASYISDVNVKLQDGRVVTKFQQDLFTVFGDKEKTILLAKLINSDFDFSSISNKAVTTQSKAIKETIQNNKVDIKGSKGSSQRQRKSLADMLD